MNNNERSRLKNARIEAKISVTVAAKRAQVEPRTWRAWETGEDHETARSPSPAALWCFFARSGLKMPGIESEAKPPPRGEAFSISTLKGGVGKTPITLNVAACLTEQNFRVAIVTNDTFYQRAIEDGMKPSLGSLVSQIHYYETHDLITHPGEIKQHRKAIRERLASLSSDEAESCTRSLQRERIALERKERATETLEELIARYDYVLLDLNYASEIVRRHASLVAIIVDTYCWMSVRAAEKYVVALREIRCREAMPSLFGLLTNYDVGGVSHELQEFIGDYVELDEEEHQRLAAARHRFCEHRERVLEMIDTLDLPMLTTELSGAYRIANERNEFAHENPLHFCYFDSVMDFAPKSHAAREIRRLTNELIHWRL
jgi:chromosome partitioning protein